MNEWIIEIDYYIYSIFFQRYYRTTKNIMLTTNMNYVKEKIYMVIIITKDTYYENTYQVNTKNCSDLTYSSQRTFTTKNLLNIQLF